MTDLSTGDQIKNLIAADIQQRMNTTLPPMVGAFTLIAETTDGDTGQPRFLTFTDLNLSLWVEMGMLTARLETIKAKWRKAQHDSDVEE